MKIAVEGMESSSGGMLLNGEFLLDPYLNPCDGAIWDGKKNGAVHTIKVKIQFYRYEFNSDAEAPLVFQMTPKGYEYVRGKGSVNDLESGKTTFFGK